MLPGETVVETETAIVLNTIATMGDPVAEVLSGLQDFASNRTTSLENLATRHHEWLAAVVKEAQRNIETSVKKRKEYSLSLDVTSEKVCDFST